MSKLKEVFPFSVKRTWVFGDRRGVLLMNVKELLMGVDMVR